MSIKDLVPKITRNRDQTLVRRGHDDPVTEFHNRMNSMFDDLFSEMGLMPRWGAGSKALSTLGTFVPKVDVSENDKEVIVSAELPGMDEKNVSVELDEDALTIHGERKDEKEERGKNWFHREQSYGSFSRVVPLPARVEGDKATAKFKRGVLTVTVPKHLEDRANRRAITIESD